MADLTLEGTSAPIATTAAVRLAAGVDVSEFPDQAFTDAELILDLELDLNDWLGEAGLNYVTIIGQGTAGSPTAEQRRDYLNLKRYSKYHLAFLMLQSILLGFAKEISNGNDTFKRLAKDAEEVLEKMQVNAEGAKRSLLEDNNTSFPVDSPFSGVGNSYDPVTDTESN